ncbi:uncharacterized protein LOC113359990 [Papaver somniferum]|uniref:uncharacterized protein LOC113359990 n=1 Tax=Papaver somniferum TaxID=3469 RepID=UPI000E6F4B00|nr:uncharacterized protein LOC113359990 [Papaver somniferum]
MEKKCVLPLVKVVLKSKDLNFINKALIVKMMWKIINSEDEWPLFIKAKFKNSNGQWNENLQLSSIWPGLKWAWNVLKDNFKWCIGNGQNVNVWFDNWIYETPLIDQTEVTHYMRNNMKMKVVDLIQDGNWSIPQELQQLFHSFSLPDIGGGQDKLF